MSLLFAGSAPAGFTPQTIITPPPGNWTRKCVAPLPNNTVLVQKMHVLGGRAIDFYYQQRERVEIGFFDRFTDATKFTGKVIDQWVCRITTTSADRQGGERLDPVVAAINPEAQAPETFLGGIGDVIGRGLEKVDSNFRLLIIGGVVISISIAVAQIARRT